MSNSNNKNLNDAETRLLLHALYAPGTEQEEHDQNADRIAEMVDRSLAGDDLARQEPGFIQHIETCSSCGSEFARLIAVQRAEAAGKISVPPPPPPNAWARVAAALNATHVDVRSDVWTVIEGGINALTTSFTMKIEAGRLMLAELPSILAPFSQLQPAPAGLRLRSSAQEQMEIPQLLFPLREEGVRVRLVPGAASDEQGMILVQIDELADGAPRPQVRVSLLDDNAHPLERLYTDTDGAVIFKELVTGHYIIQIDLGRGYNCPFHIA